MKTRTRKHSRRHRRRTLRRIPRGTRAMKGGADRFPLLPSTKAIAVSNPESSDNLLAFRGRI